MSAYAFVQYSDIQSVVRALRKMDGEHIGSNKIKVRAANISVVIEARCPTGTVGVLAANVTE